MIETFGGGFPFCPFVLFGYRFGANFETSKGGVRRSLRSTKGTRGCRAYSTGTDPYVSVEDLDGTMTVRSGSPVGPIRWERERSLGSGNVGREKGPCMVGVEGCVCEEVHGVRV